MSAVALVTKVEAEQKPRLPELKSVVPLSSVANPCRLTVVELAVMVPFTIMRIREEALVGVMDVVRRVGTNAIDVVAEDDEFVKATIVWRICI